MNTASAAPPPPPPATCNADTTVCKSFELGPGGGSPESGITNIISNGTHNGDDWNALFDGAGNKVGGVSGDATFIRDDISGDSKSATPDRTTFTSSGSDKNTDLVSTWNWGTTNVPAKTDVTNAYIRGINATDGLLVFFGAERSAPNGASYIDIELFQDEVGLDRDPKTSPCPNAQCKFEGEHTAGDVLVSMAFTNGGALGVVEFRKRNDANTGYELIATLTGEGCNKDAIGLLQPGDVCAFNNGAAIDGGPWDNFDSQANILTNLPKNAFTEWGVNVTKALGGETPCFPTVQVKTRSSPSFTAELKDFAVKGFQSCSTLTTTKIHRGPSVGGNHLPDEEDIQGTSVAFLTQVHDKAIVTGSDPNTQPTGSITFQLFNTGDCGFGVGNLPVQTYGPIALTPIGGGVAVAESPTSPALTPGAWSYLATYSGGGQYPGSVAPCEPLTVNTATSAVNTDIRLNDLNGDSVLNTRVKPGLKVVDVAEITGTPNGPDPTGTLTFIKYTNGNCSGDGDPEVITLQDPDGDGLASAVSSQATTTDSGFLSFHAIYSGDSNYSGSSSSVCEPLCSFYTTEEQLELQP